MPCKHAHRVHLARTLAPTCLGTGNQNIPQTRLHPDATAPRGATWWSRAAAHRAPAPGCSAALALLGGPAAPGATRLITATHFRRPAAPAGDGAGRHRRPAGLLGGAGAAGRAGGAARRRRAGGRIRAAAGRAARARRAAAALPGAAGARRPLPLLATQLVLSNGTIKAVSKESSCLRRTSLCTRQDACICTASNSYADLDGRRSCKAAKPWACRGRTCLIAYACCKA